MLRDKPIENLAQSIELGAEKKWRKAELHGNEEERVMRFLGVGPSTLKRGAETPHNIHQDRYDSTLYQELREASDKVQHLEGRGVETFPALLQDLWATFYKADPTLQGQEKVSTTHQINRPFVERLLEDNATKEARLSTMLDELSAGVAATEAGEKLVDEINSREDLKEAMQQARESKKAEKRGDAATAEELMAQAQKTLQSAARDVRRAVRESIKAGQEKAEELQTTLAGWGLEPGDLKQVPIGDRLKLAETITGRSNLKKIADLVGKMRNLARAKQQQKIKKQRDEIHSITVGGELHHTLPVELAGLRHPLRRLDFYRRYTEKQLLQYELEHQERQGRGPIVAAIDISGSMYGNPLEWAIASALALADTASRQKRHCHIMFFDTEIQKEFTFTPGERSAEKYIQMATVGTGGGTEYLPALTRAWEVINQKEFEKADIVMITDGLCWLEDEFQERFITWKKQKKVSCYTVLIGQGALEGLKVWNDKVWQTSESKLAEAGGEIAGEIFEDVY